MQAHRLCCNLLGRFAAVSAKTAREKWQELSWNLLTCFYALKRINSVFTQRGSDAEVSRRRGGFTITEVVVAVLVLATISTAYYLGISSCFSVVKTSQEDIRATQIMMQKLEAVRLCTWSELTNFSFREPYDPSGSTNNTSGIYYFGTVAKGPATIIPNTASYQNNMCLVTVNLVWTNNASTHPLVHNRQMQTLYARYGLQSYIWGAIQ